MKSIKKPVSLICAAAMVMTSWVVPIAAQADTVPEPIIAVTFDDGGSDYTLSDATLTEGRDGNAVLTADSAYASVSDVSGLSSLSSDFSVSIWCYPTTSDVWWSRLFDIGASQDNYVFLASSLGNDCPRFAIKSNGTEQYLDSEKALDINEWNNVVVTREGDQTKIYVNGFLGGTSDTMTYTLADVASPTNNYLGKSQFSDPYFTGMIDDFKVYDTALDLDEVRTVAAEAYERKVEAVVNSYDRYLIDVNFMSGDTEVYQVKPSQTITAKVDIKNYTAEDTIITASLQNGSDVLSTQSANYPAAEEKTLELSASAPTSTGTLKVVVSDSSGTTYDAAFIDVTTSPAEFPDASPEDDDATTYGAHDPTIFKDPVGGKYWAYSSHNLVFESDDLINWTKHDYTSTVTIPDTAKEFIESNYSNTTANTTYWAPDVLYVEDSDYPYWFYLSCSCGLGGRNSVISLVKAKSPGLWDGETEDCGVVLASVESNSYNTNAIDANIYTEDGVNYFIWGSFWKGIHGAKLTDDGFVDGVDYTSDATILSSCKSFGSRLFSTPSGVFGPEGPFTINNSDTGYTYMFTSYGWLGTNYNCRIARTSTAMSGVIGSSSPHTKFLDAQGRKVGTTYVDQSDKSVLWGYKMIGSYKIGDGITYYGNGHNSVLQDDDENWYYVEHCRKVADATAYLQVRKMLWTEDGWPVVSPVVYAGEKEQTLSETMLYGSWDIAQVGHTIFKDGVTDVSTCTSSDADLPVESFRATLKKDHTFEDGTWAFDGDHTLTLTFTKDGNESDNEYYAAGDTMTLFVLPGYDKDEQRSVLTVTGTDNNYVTSFGIKASATAVITTPPAIDTTPVSLEKSQYGNPILGFDADGNTLYGGDPAATVVGDTVYIIVGHDTASDESYVMPEWVAYSSKDLKNWTYEGVIMEATDISWRSNDTSAWASQMIEHNGKYYLYFCTWDKTSSGKQSIGVAVADSPTGPYTDIGSPLVSGNTTTVGAVASHDDIDPTVFVETVDGTEHRYLAWGNSVYYMCELNDDMISVKDQNEDGTIDNTNDIKRQKIRNSDTSYTEAPWLYKRDGKYYTFYAAGWREAMAYATSEDLSSGKWQYGGIIMSPTATSNTNHPSVIDFNGKTYFVYHNGALTHGSGFRRSVCIQEIEFDSDGNVIPLTEMSTGIDGTATTILDYNGKYVGHDEFTNPYTDASYPLSESVKTYSEEDALNTAWELVAGLSDTTDENLVSIQSVNKPGLYIGVSDDEVKILPDSTGTLAKNLTFKSVEGLNGSGVSFESVSNSGLYLTSSTSGLTLSYGANADAATFTIGSAPQATAVPTIAPTPTPGPEATLTPDITNDFDDISTGALITQGTSDQTPYTTDGVQLYVGTRSGSSAAATGWYAESDDDGTAIVLQSNKWANSSRGARLAFTTPYIPDGGYVQLDVDVKLASGSIYYNDSTSSDSGTTDISSYFTTGSYNRLKITISNNDDDYTRTIYVDDVQVAQDEMETFPVIWGTLTDDSSATKKIYFDNLSIITIAQTEPADPEPMMAQITDQYIEDGVISFTLKNANAFGSVSILAAEYGADNTLEAVEIKDIEVVSSAQRVTMDYTKKDESNTLKLYAWCEMIPTAASVEVEAPAVPAGYTSYFSFNDNLTDTVGGFEGSTVGAKANATASSSDASYEEGYSGSAVSMTGSDSDGIKLGKIVTDSKYTISFYTKINAITACTAGIFLDTDGGTSWVSAPIGWKSDGTVMVWSHNSSGYIDLLSSAVASTGKWYNVTICADGDTAELYLDGEQIASGTVADIATDDTVVYLGVNYWDTPFNGLIDEMYVYNGTTLSASEVSQLYRATKQN